MTDEEIRIAIAEACGLFRTKPLRRTTRKGTDDPNGVRLWYCSEHMGGAATYDEVPNYPECLNAMHEAEEERFGDWGDHSDLWHLYEVNLRNVCGMRNHWMSATARQRAEAFLRTLNLWCVSSKPLT